MLPVPTEKKPKAVLLLSGGLDSILAGKLLVDQGVDLAALNLTSPFCNCSPKGQGCSSAVRAASTRREYGTTQLSLIWKTAIPALCLLAILAILRAPGRRENSAQPDTQPAAATAAFPETDSLRPTMANYLLAANQSPEALDALLAKQIRLYSSAPAPDWRSLNLTD